MGLGSAGDGESRFAANVEALVSVIGHTGTEPSRWAMYRTDRKTRGRRIYGGVRLGPVFS